MMGLTIQLWSCVHHDVCRQQASGRADHLGPLFVSGVCLAVVQGAQRAHLQSRLCSEPADHLEVPSHVQGG